MLHTIEEDTDGELIEDKLVVLRDQLLQLSQTEQQLNCASISEHLPDMVEIQPQSAQCTAIIAIQNTLRVKKNFFLFSTSQIFHYFIYSNGNASSRKLLLSTRDC